MPNYKAENVRHRGFHVRATFQNGKTHGRVFSDGRMIHKTEASSLAEALDSCRAWVDAYVAERAAARNGCAPAPREYVAAFRSLGKKVSERHRSILRAHYAAPERSSTVGELAKAAGFRTDATLHLNYERLGTLLLDFLQIELARRADGTAVAVSALATGDGSSPEDPLVLRPEVASALKELGWVS